MRVDQTKPKPKNEPKVVNSNGKVDIDIVYILDRSGSMGYNTQKDSKISVALVGINEGIKALKLDPNANYTFSFVSFDDTIEREYWRVPLSTVDSVFVRTGNTTALYQAVGETIEELSDLVKNNKVLVNIFTDGQENASRGKYKNSNTLKELIEKLKKENFTITFEGTKQDTDFVIRNLSVDSSNTLIHDNTADSVYRNASVRTQSTLSYSKRLVDGEDVSRGFYKEQEQ